MPHYYTHLQTADGLERDEIGTEYPNLETAYLNACQGLPKLMAELVEEGHDPASCILKIHDEDDLLLMEVPFLERVTKRRKPSSRPTASSEMQALFNRLDIVVLSIRVQTEQLQTNMLEAQRHLESTRVIIRDELTCFRDLGIKK